MAFLLVLAIAVANNLDNTGVAIAYGLAHIRIRPLMNLWIAIITFGITAASGMAGLRVAHLLAIPLVKALSALILCGAGLLILFPSLTRRSRAGAAEEDSRSSAPSDPGSDPHSTTPGCESREIRFVAGTLLGIALSLNNIAGGFSAGLIHLSVLWTALSSAALSFLVLWFGNWAGERLGTPRLGQHAQTVAGTLLVLIGLYQLV